MFDFISYSRDSGFEIKILPPVDGVLIHLELRDPDTGYFERRAITDAEASNAMLADFYKEIPHKDTRPEWCPLIDLTDDGK